MIIVFDAKCLLCNGWVQFLLKHDSKGVFQFASIQGAAGRAFLDKAGLQEEGLQTFLLVDGANAWGNTAAIFRVLGGLGWPWKTAWLGWLMPAPLRDAMYRWIARNRYRFFGRSDVCIMPPADFKTRFLD